MRRTQMMSHSSASAVWAGNHPKISEESCVGLAPFVGALAVGFGFLKPKVIARMNLNYPTSLAGKCSVDTKDVRETIAYLLWKASTNRPAV